jgi:hypothetical protein
MSEINKIYNLTTENEVNIHLGMTLTRDRPNKSITISQPGKMLDRYDLPLDKTAYIPINPNV